MLPLTSPEVQSRPAGPGDAGLVHALYLKTPGYFDIISIPLPSLAEVERELLAGELDRQRFIELILLPQEPFGRDGVVDPDSGWCVAGYLDYKLDYPEPRDATVNLLLIQDPYQGRGIGRLTVADLERRLVGRATRVLASIYGRNPRAERFWTSMGYSYAIDARPVLEWYAKRLA